MKHVIAKVLLAGLVIGFLIIDWHPRSPMRGLLTGMVGLAMILAFIDSALGEDGK